MTREEANLTIDYLKEMQEGYIEGEGYERHPLPEWYALDKAIEALEQESMRDATPEERESVDAYIKSISKPTGIEFDEEPRGDAISRQAAIDAFERFIHELGIEDEPYNYGEMALSAKNVPPVNPQETGKWIKMPLVETGQKFSHKCSLCGRNILALNGLSEFPYCHCGAKMVDEQESEE